MSYCKLKLPTEGQFFVVFMAVIIIVGTIAVYQTYQYGLLEVEEYAIFISDMGCDALEFQALNHEWSTERSMALAEHGERC